MPDMIEPRMLTLFEKASSLILANIKMDLLDGIDQAEVKKNCSGFLLFIIYHGRYQKYTSYSESVIHLKIYYFSVGLPVTPSSHNLLYVLI